MANKSHSETAELSDDLDSISLTSTVGSEHKSEYEVEDILAEWYFDDHMKYLVKWAGYDEQWCTWEPASSFDTADTLVDWREKKQAIAEGKIEPFDVEAWEERVQRREDEHNERVRRRAAKRKRLAASKLERHPTASMVSDEAALFVPPASPPSRNPGASPSQQQPPKDSVPHTASPVSGQGSKSTTRKPQPSQQVQSPHPHSTLPKRAILSEFGSEPGRPRRQSRWESRWDEPSPDVTQLQLMKPSEFPARTGHSKHATIMPTKLSAGVHSFPSVTKQSNPEDTSPSTASSTRPASNGTFSSAHPPRLRDRDPERPTRASEPQGRPEPIHRLADCYRPGMDRPVTPTPRAHREPIHRAADCYRPGSDSPVTLSEPRAHHEPTRRSGDSYSLSARHDSNMAPTSLRHYHLSAEEHIQRMPIGEPSSDATYTSNGYFWNPGEVLAHIHFGPERTYIGAARLCGASIGASAELIQSKPKKQAKLEVWFRYLCTGDDYATLCEGTQNRFWCNSWMEGFGDSNKDLFDMAEHLRERNLIAIHYNPKGRGNVWLAYSRWSPEFNFLNRDTQRVPESVPMFLAVRSALLPIEQLAVSGMVQHPYVQCGPPNSPLVERASRPVVNTSTAISGASSTVPVATTHDLNKPPTFLTQTGLRSESVPVNSEMGDQAPADLRSRRASISNTSTIHRSSNEQKQSNAGQPLPMKVPDPAPGTSLVAQSSVDVYMDNVFKTNFNITMQELARVADSGAGSTASIFYLQFPLDDPECYEQEYKLMEEFLKAHKMIVWSNRNRADWGKFVNNAKQGVVLFHESFCDYQALDPPINIVLRNPSVNLWNVRLAKPLHLPDPDFPGTHFQRLFPHGGVILVTQDVLDYDPSGIAVLLRWFYDYQSAKLGTWRVLFFPNVLEWLEDKLENEKQNPPRNHLWLTIIVMIMKNNTIDGLFDPDSLDARYPGENTNVLSFLSIPDYGSRSENDHPSIPKNLTQEQRNEDHVVECFAGWGLVYGARFRRFIVITRPDPLHILSQRWQSWGHLEVQKGLKAFFRNFEVEYNAYWKDITKGSTNKQSSMISPSPTTPNIPSSATPKDTAPELDEQSRWRPPSKVPHPAPYK